MTKDAPVYVATCDVQYKIIDPKTMKPTWQPHESITIMDTSIDKLTEKAHMYIGRPERIDGVIAIQLTGKIPLMQQVQHAHFDHKDSMYVHIHILREQNHALTHDFDAPSKGVSSNGLV